MEPVQIALVAVSAVLFVSLVLWGRTARKGSRARRTAGEARTEAGHSLAQLASVRRGEREAAWTAATATERLQRSLLDLDKAEHEAKRLTADVESLQDQVTHLDGALLGLKQEHSATLDRLGSAESSLETALRRATEGERPNVVPGCNPNNVM